VAELLDLPTPAVSTGPAQLDANKSSLVLLVGRKGEGKSVIARNLYRSYPYDKLAIDVNGDADPGPDAEPLRPPLPWSFPVDQDGRPRNLHYRADPKSATYRDDLDRAIGLALFPQDRRSMVWLDEIGEVTTGNTTPPHLRLLLMQSRHHGPASALMCGPRPMNIDPLCVSQADRIYIFDLPNPADRQRLAENMGYPPARLNAELEETLRRGRFWHLVYDAETHTMYRMPPVPEG